MEKLKNERRKCDYCRGLGILTRVTNRSFDTPSYTVTCQKCGGTGYEPVKQEIKENQNIEKCSCGKPLWEWVDENTIRIFGSLADYVISFVSIDLICSSCKKHIHKTAEMVEVMKDLLKDENAGNREALNYFKIMSLKFRPYAFLSESERGRIKEKLSENQKLVFNCLLSGDMNTLSDAIAEKLGLPQKIVEKHLDTIKEEVKKVCPHFNSYRRIDILP